MITFGKFGRHGRLGNQLFQLASLRGIAERNGDILALPQWRYADYFDFPESQIGESPECRIKEATFHYNPEQFDVDPAKVTDIEGYFQSAKYFGSNSPSFNPAFLKEVKRKHYTFTRKTIAVHIRRGDYVDNPNYYLLPENYYVLALACHFPDFENYDILVFSDNIDYAKIHFSCLDNVYFSEGKSDVEDLALMSLCDHFILSNSSYSWWGAWLGEKKHSKIIRPAHRFQGRLKASSDTKDFRPDHWTAFDHEKERYDLSNVTFTIPVLFDHKDREYNLRLSVCMLQRSFSARIIVGEQGGKHLAFVEEFVRYVPFRLPTFHRTKMLNDMCMMSDTEIVVNWDADVIIPPLQIILAVKQIMSRKSDFVYPYDGRFCRVPRVSFPYISKNLDIGLIGAHRLIGDDQYNSVGGAIFCRRAAFIGAGMENEYFISYGPEDHERRERFQRMGFTVTRVNGKLFHMDHYRGPNRSRRCPYFQDNHKLYERQKAMTDNELREFVATWKWVKREAKMIA